MTIDHQLREAAAEVRAAVSGRRGTLLAEIAVQDATTGRRLRNVHVLVAAAGVVLLAAIGLAAVNLLDGDAPSTVVASTSEDSPAGNVAQPDSPSQPSSADADVLDELELVYSAGLVPLDTLAPDGVPLVFSQDVGLMAVPGSPPTPDGAAAVEGEWMVMRFHTTTGRVEGTSLRIFAVPPGSDTPPVGGTSGLPPLELWLTTKQGATESQLYGVAPSGTSEIRIQRPGADDIVITRFSERPAVERSAFIHSVSLDDLYRGAPSTWTAHVSDAAGTVQEVTLTSDGGYRTPVTSRPWVEDLFAGPLIAGEVDFAEELVQVACPDPSAGGQPVDGAVDGYPSYASPEAALTAFIDDPPAAAAAHLPVSNYIHVNPSQDPALFAVPSSSYGLPSVVAAVTVVRAPDGLWTVASWSAAGC